MYYTVLFLLTSSSMLNTGLLKKVHLNSKLLLSNLYTYRVFLKNFRVSLYMIKELVVRSLEKVS